MRLDEVTESHLQELIEDGVPESRELDFKRDTYGNSDSDKRELLADVTSFANTIGGHIIIGMDEANGVASALVGISDKADAECLRLEQIVRNGIQPRLSGLAIRCVPLATGRNAIVIRVPRSWIPPHRIIAQGSNKFYARDGRGKYEPDVDQLRTLFQFAPTITERVRDFRFDRIAKIRAAQAPVPLMGSSALVLHILPFTAFTEGRRFSVDELMAESSHFRVMSGRGSEHLNLDGMITVTKGQPMEPGLPIVHAAYTQVWRSGQVEAVRSGIARSPADEDDEKVVLTGRAETLLVDSLRSYLLGMAGLGIAPPLVILVTFSGVAGAQARDAFSHYDEYDVVPTFDRDVVNLSEVVITEWPESSEQAIASLLKPVFDELANAAGILRSRQFQNGRWHRQNI
jgi:Putative DNA-binding domain